MNMGGLLCWRGILTTVPIDPVDDPETSTDEWLHTMSTRSTESINTDDSNPFEIRSDPQDDDDSDRDL